MKKILAIVFVMLVASIAIICVTGITVNAKKDKVAITENIKYGDKSVAEGVTVRREATYDRHLFWDTTYTLGENPVSDTEFEFYGMERRSDNSDYHRITLDIDIAFGCDFDRPAEEQTGLDRVFKEMYDSAEPGEEVRRVVKLKDYYEYYPIGVNIKLPEDVFVNIYAHDANLKSGNSNDYLHMYEVFNEFFKIPVRDNEEYEVSISKDANGASVGIGSGLVSDNYYWINTCSTYSDDRAFFTINNRNGAGEFVDTSLIPGGYGIYSFVYGDAAKKYKTKIDADSLAMVYPLEEEVIVDALVMNNDKTQLLLFTLEGEENFVTVIDASTMQMRQKISLGSDDVNEVYVGEDFIVLYTVDSKFGLLAENETGEYEYRFSVNSHMENPEYSYLYPDDFDYDGEKLVAVGGIFDDMRGGPEKCGFYVSVYDESGLTYYAEYESSLSVHTNMMDYHFNCQPVELECRIGE